MGALRPIVIERQACMTADRVEIVLGCHGSHCGTGSFVSCRHHTSWDSDSDLDGLGPGLGGYMYCCAVRRTDALF